MLYTSDLRDTGAGDPHRIRLQVKGSASTRILPHLLGSRVGDIWKLHLTDFFGFTGCITINDIDRISILKSSSNGWNIESIVTFAVDSEYWELTSADFNVIQWIDGDSEDECKEFTLTLLTSASKCICFLYSYKATLNMKYCKAKDRQLLPYICFAFQL